MPLDAGELANVVAKATEARDRLIEALDLLDNAAFNPMQVYMKLSTAEGRAREAKDALMADWQD